MTRERLFRKSKATGRFLPVNVPAENSVLYSRKRLSEKWKKYAWLEADFGKIDERTGMLTAGVFQGWDWVGSIHTCVGNGVAKGRLGSSKEFKEPTDAQKKLGITGIYYPCYSPNREVFVGNEADVFRCLMIDVETY